MPWQWSQSLNEGPGATSLPDNPPDVSPAPAQSDEASTLLKNTPSAKDANSGPESRDQKLARLRDEQARIQEQRKRMRLLLQLEEEEQRVQAEINRLENE
jgi:hypothetical protein